MQVLVLNSGSSSLKFKLFDMPREGELARGMIERIGEGDGQTRLTCRPERGSDLRASISCADHAQAVCLLLERLADLSRGGLEPKLLGHRVVHGGHLFSGPALVTDDVISQIESIQDLAPLHMPPALAVLRYCRERMPRIHQIACFDTTFFCTMPAKSLLYAVPRRWTTDLGVRRFGFHGISHQYVTQCVSDMLGIALDRLKLISAHLGNGASITAFDRGRVLDTSMGFTPLEGLIMGTRAGYLDPAVLQYVQRRTGMNLNQMVEILNTRSGLTAISGVGRDLRTIMEARAQGHAGAELAIDMYVHTLRKYVGAYAFALGGPHALVLTGGVGENAAQLREMVLTGLDEMGLIMDADANRNMVAGRTGLISSADSRIKILVIPTDEERMIARQAYRLAINSETVP